MRKGEEFAGKDFRRLRVGARCGGLRGHLGTVAGFGGGCSEGLFEQESE